MAGGHIQKDTETLKGEDVTLEVSVTESQKKILIIITKEDEFLFLLKK